MRNLEASIKYLRESGVTLERVQEELDYRDSSNLSWDSDLYEYSTEELEEMEVNWDDMVLIMKKADMNYEPELRKEIESFKTCDGAERAWKRWAFGAITFAHSAKLITKEQQYSLYKEYEILG